MGFSSTSGDESKAVSLLNWDRERSVSLSLVGNK